MPKTEPRAEEVRIPTSRGDINGDLILPPDAGGVIVFAHGSGSSRFSPRNRKVAEDLRGYGFGTLLFDLLTASEEEVDAVTREYRFDIDLLADRLALASQWLAAKPDAANLPQGYFGSSTGAAAALRAQPKVGSRIGAIVSRGGRADMGAEALPIVTAPTLLIVGGLDTPVLEMNRAAMTQMTTEVRLEIVEGATHLFEEPGKLEEVVRLAAEWFRTHLGA
jgi:pimeloyl-ACP methyl ester carboxylesterase